MGALAATGRRPASASRPALGILIASTLLGCATAAPDTERAVDGRESQRGLLAKTMPNAAAAAEDPTGSDPAAAQLPAPTDDTRPGRLLIYSAITGHVPLEERTDYGTNQRHMTPAEREAARARQIETEIQAELAKQEAIGGTETSRAQADAPVFAPEFDPVADPLAAPPAPELRKLPATLFESREITIPPGQWQNTGSLRVVRRSLDVDGDGNPEEVRYIDTSSGLLLRAELDRDFDGDLDAWITYENGAPVIQVLDEDGDGNGDAWERYRDGTLLAKTSDDDRDGVKDVFYRYDATELVEKLRDADNDGTIDRVETFHDRRRKHTQEDRTMNGQMDTWTTYTVYEGREVISRIERDSRDRGKPNIVEIYETQGTSTRLSRKEEDLDGDGKPDIVSTYEDGRLVQRAISDEALSPL